ncbi:hypothetical protein NKH77_28510 [Streptomyces sp. M19]
MADQLPVRDGDALPPWPPVNRTSARSSGSGGRASPGSAAARASKPTTRQGSPPATPARRGRPR